MNKKVGLIFLCILMVLTVAGCGEKKAEEPKYPALEDVEAPSNAEEGSYGGFTAQYDADNWVFNTGLGQFAIYDKEDFESSSDKVTNINVRVSGEYDGKIDEELMNELMKQLKVIGMNGFEITDNKIMTFNGEPIIYYEAETTLTDDMIDLLIEEGSITEADITALGGREKLKNSGSVSQVGINAVVDGNMLAVTGTYNEDPSEVLDAMKLLIKTGKVD